MNITTRTKTYFLFVWNSNLTGCSVFYLAVLSLQKETYWGIHIKKALAWLRAVEVCVQVCVSRERDKKKKQNKKGFLQ